jgi:membrane protein YqaA with SNARE-associated domain
MHEIIFLIKQLFIPYGIWGLLLLSFLDSTFVPMPQVIDTLVIVLSLSKPHLMAFYALSAVVGSLLGTSILYFLGKKGGQALLHKKLSRGGMERIQYLLHKYDILSILLAGIIPPPFPYKAFIFAVGAFQLLYHRFLLAVFVSRSCRFYLEGVMTVLYGEEVITFLRERPLFAAFIIPGVFLVGFLIYKILINILTRQEAG